MLLVRRTLGKFPTPPLSRRLSSRASAVLSALDIPTTPIELPGIYDGEWKGSGEVFQSVCPATGEVLANVKSVSCNICSVRCPRSSTCWWPRVSFYRTALLLSGPPQASPAELHGALVRTREAYVYFRSIPAPKRGEIIRQIREALAAKVRRNNSCMGYNLSLTSHLPFFCSAMSSALSYRSRWARSLPRE
jgi:aldehyde dehydrogenase family 7 protein A1